MGFRQASAVSRIKQKWTFYCRVVNIDAKNEPPSEGESKEIIDACSETPTSSSVWNVSRVKCGLEGVCRNAQHLHENKLSDISIEPEKQRIASPHTKTTQ